MTSLLDGTFFASGGDRLRELLHESEAEPSFGEFGLAGDGEFGGLGGGGAVGLGASERDCVFAGEDGAGAFGIDLR